MDSLHGRTAFITGGAGGIGLGIARALARHGAAIALADVDEPKLDDAVSELSEMTPTRSFVLDVRQRDAYAEVAEAAEAELGPVSVLINNAGVIDSVSPSQMAYSMWDYVMGINLNGVYNGIQEFVPRMIRRGEGAHVLNTSSVAGLCATRSGYLYHASKYAVVGLSESLRIELEHHGIGVSVLCPGAVATDIVENTRQFRPDSAPARSRRIEGILADAHTALHEQGVAADAVGEHVVDAIMHNRPYVLTDDSVVGPLRERTEAILAAVPPEALASAVSNRQQPPASAQTQEGDR